MNQEHLLELAASGAYHQAFLGSLIGGAVSLVGGLLGRSDQKKKDKAAAKAAATPQVTTSTLFDRTQTNSKGGATQTSTGFAGSDSDTRSFADNQHSSTSTTTTGVSLGRLVQEAELAGFNPLTVLRAGLGGAFSTTTTKNTARDVNRSHVVGTSSQWSTQRSEQEQWQKTDNVTRQEGKNITTGHNAMAAVPQAPSVGSVIANAAGNAFDTYRQDQQRAADNAYRDKVLDAQIAARATPSAANTSGSSFYVPSMVSAGSAVRQGATAALSRSAPRTPSVETPTVTNPYSGNIQVDDTVSDIAAAEDRYGELGALPFAIRNYIADLLKNVTGTTTAERAAVRQGLVTDASAALSQSVNGARQKLAEMNGAATPAAQVGAMISRPPSRGGGGGGW